MIEYVTDKGLAQAIEAVIKGFREFEPLIVNQISIGQVLKIRTDAKGDMQPCKGDPIVTRKIGPAERLYSHADYLLIVDAQAYSTATTKQQEALLHHGLSRILIENKNGIPKCKLAKPDMVAFKMTVLRFGEAAPGVISLCQDVFLDSDISEKVLEMGRVLGERLLTASRALEGGQPVNKKKDFPVDISDKSSKS